MAGGAVPRGEIRLPKAEQEQSYSAPSPAGDRRGFLSLRHFIALAVTVFFSAAGLVPPEDIAFVVFSLLYIYFISKFSFPCISPPPEKPVFDTKKKLFRLYMLATAVIGLLLPIAYIFEGFFGGDKEGIKAAAPHVFLLASQVFAEGLTAPRRFSLPVKVFVPVLFNSRRIFTIMEWLRTEMEEKEEGYRDSGRRRLYMGRSLAVANMGLWSFNLFGFLLPVYLPKAFKKYYSGYNDSMHAD